MKKIIKKLIIRRLETFYITPWWMKRAYYDLQSDKMVMVAVPLNYVVEIAWRINLKWGEYRHKPTWLDAIIKQRAETRIVTGDTSDGFHTFNELYEHRCTLYLALMASNPNMSWASAKHFDGTAFDGWFVAGMELPTGDVTYHLPDSMWEMAKKTGACIMVRGKEWDGHSAADVVERIQKWVKEGAK